MERSDTAFFAICSDSRINLAACNKAVCSAHSNNGAAFASSKSATIAFFVAVR